MTRTSCLPKPRPKCFVGIAVLALLVGCADDRDPSGSGAINVSTTSEVVVAQPTQAVLRSELAHDTAPAVEAAQYQLYVNGINRFGLELFRRKCAASDRNVLFSPVSLSVALSMAYAGARNNTAAEMKQVLGDPFGDLAYHRAVNRLIIDLRSRNLTAATAEGPQSVELSLVDTWFLQREFPIKKAYMDLLATEYDAGVRLADFGGDLMGARELINQYASDNTKGKITDLIRANDVTPLTRAVLVNAFYLNATWKDPFELTMTQNRDFKLVSGETVSIPTMNATRTLGYQAGSNYQAVRVPYIGDALSMLVVLPAEGQFAVVRDAVDEAWVRGVDAALAPRKVALALPKFRLLWGTEELNQELGSMGMPEAFVEGEADFTGITGSTPSDGLFIYKVLHKTFVGIDEAGTEAAAVSAVIMNTRSMTEATMTVERPFLFSILDKSGAVLFVGQVMDPR